VEKAPPLKSDEDIKYFGDNKATFVGKGFEEVSSSIKDSLYQQEIFTNHKKYSPRLDRKQR
jgi:hypothetical protein